MGVILDIWNNLSKGEKIDAINITTNKVQISNELSKNVKLHSPSLEILAKVLHFRVKTFQNISSESFYNKLEMFVNSADEKTAEGVICDYLFNFIAIKLNTILVDFLDAMGIPHDTGMIISEDAIPKEVFAAGISAIRQKYDVREIGIYLSFVLATSGKTDVWRHLKDSLFELEFNPSAIIMNQEKTTVESNAIKINGQEDNPQFTTFDTIITKEIIASVIGQEGSLNQEQVEDLIDEAVELNASRQRTLFHKGFMHAVFDKELNCHFPGENDVRRVWYMNGAIHGLYRQNKNSEILNILQKNEDIVEQMKSARDIACIITVTHLVFELMMEARVYSKLIGFIEASLDNRYCAGADFRGLVIKILESGSDLVRQGMGLEALELLKVLEFRQEELSPSIKNRYKRKMAQAYQLKGDLRHAEKMLENLLKVDDEFEDRPNAAADYALVKAGHKSLYNLIKIDTQGQVKSVKESLQPVLNILEETSQKYVENAVNSNFCLGLYVLLDEKNPVRAAALLEKSLFGMEKKEKAYRFGGLIAWNRFLLAIAMIESMQPENYIKALDLIEKSSASEIKFSPWLWLRALKSASVYDDMTMAGKIAGQINNNKKMNLREIFDAIGFENVIKIDSLLEQFFEYAHFFNTDKVYILKGLEIMLENVLEDHCENNCDIAIRILDTLEVLSEEDGDIRRKFIELLKDRKNFHPAWSESEAQNCLVRLYEKDGKLKQASEILKIKFYEAINNANEAKQIDSINIFEKIKELQSETSEDILKLEMLLTAKDLSAEKVTAVSEPKLVRLSLYYIGGDETQESFQADIVSYFKAEYPGLKLDFCFSGWSSNWIYDYDNIKARIDSYNALILSPYVRTTLGQKVRKLCNDRKKHRYNCTGKGKSFIIRSIESAIKMEIAGNIIL